MDSMQLCLCQRVAQQHRESKSVSGVEWKVLVQMLAAENELFEQVVNGIEVEKIMKNK